MPSYNEGGFGGGEEEFGEEMEQLNRLGNLFKEMLEPMIPGETVGERAAGANVMAGLGMGGVAGASAFAPMLWAMLMGGGGANLPKMEKATKSLVGMAKNPNTQGFSKLLGHGSSRLPMEAGIVDVGKMKAVMAATNKSFIQAKRVASRAGAGRWEGSMFGPR